MVNLEELINCTSNCVTLFYHGSLYEHFDVHLVTSNIFFFAPRWSNYWNNFSFSQFFFSSQLYFRCILDFLPAPVISLLYLLAYYISWFKIISGAIKQQQQLINVFLECVFSPQATSRRCCCGSTAAHTSTSYIFFGFFKPPLLAAPFC